MRTELILAAVMTGLVMWAAGGAAIAAEVIKASEQDLELVRGRLYASLTELSAAQAGATVANAEKWLRVMRPDGSWADQDYADTNAERWKCGGHLPRVLDFAMAGRQQGAVPEEKRSEYIAAAVRSLRFWLSADPTNTNWWHNEIGVPLQVGNTLIILGEDAPEEVRQRGIELMRRSRWSKWTGQNLVWGTRIQIIRACVAGDLDAAAEAFGRMYEEVRIAGGRAEGIKPDWSFYQHGELLYSGGYGSGFTSDTSRLALLSRDTTMAIPPEKLEILVSHLLEGQAWMTRGRYWDYSATGREIVRKGKNARSLGTPARDLAVLYPTRGKELLDLAARVSGDAKAPAISGNRHFWFSDYMVHHRADWFASARMYSARTKNTDPLINGESRKSHYLAEGATYIMQSGSEYEDIFPVWDWHKIPGTTVEQGTPFDPKQVSRAGTERFVGGVSDGVYGCATMDLATGKLRAKKSWFFFDEGFVALGAGITCDSDNEVVTTMNQCLMNGDVVMAVSGEAVPRGDHRVDAGWLWHGRVGYVPLEGTAIHLRNDQQRGNWKEISSGASAELVERDVFLASVEHGQRPVDAKYAYMVLPAITAGETAAAAQTAPMQVLSNTPALQAVRHEKAKITQAIFREAGRVNCGALEVSVDAPCALMVKQQGDDITFTAGNPANEPAEITVMVNAPLEGDDATAQPHRNTKIIVKLPGGTDAGKSVSTSARVVKVNLNIATFYSPCRGTRRYDLHRRPSTAGHVAR